MSDFDAFIGLDVHKETIAVAIADTGREGEVRYYGEINNTPTTLNALLRKLCKKYNHLLFCYEAGPCGYSIYRQIIAKGHNCIVVAPSLTPTKPGDHIKTDRRDALSLARLLRAGELSAVWVPDAHHEAMRDLMRGRTAAMESVRRARQQLQGFLLRQGVSNPYKTSWTKAHMAWLKSLTFEQPAHHILVQELLYCIEEANQRQERIEQQITNLIPNWSMAPVVQSIQAMRGVSLISAITLVTEIGDFTRFSNPCQLMGYLGLVPSEFSSGKRVTRGHITKAGSRHARRVLIEGAWAYSHPPRVGSEIIKRQLGLPMEVRQKAWDAQIRLCNRYRRLVARGKCKNTIVTAIAREMVGFIWAIAKMVATSPQKA